ncbi:MAG TPA: SRPBCC family protein [Solirubrobacteraceae bacterium]|nr:SRPBCC family protein [Solirubrobacteraceae bacterium]
MTSGTVLDIGPLGVQVEIRRTAAETGGELFEFDVVGRARGFLAQPHVHTQQTERHEVIEGTMRLVVDGRTYLLREGESMEVPPGTPHRQLGGDDGPGRVRVQLRPAGHTGEFLARLAELSAQGAITRSGFPRPLAAAGIVRDFGDEGHAARPPVRVQRALAGALLHVASHEYLFVDEWDVAAPREAVFDALADARSYPVWWRPVYLEVEADGEPAVGKAARQHFKGRLPYHLHTRSRIVRYEPPEVLEVDVDGDLRGHGRWTLTATGAGSTHVRFDWQVFADRKLLRILTPILRPAFRWNHNWAIARAREGLEPHARRRAMRPADAPPRAA